MSVAVPVISSVDGTTREIYLLSGVVSYHPVDDIAAELQQLRNDDDNHRWYYPLVIEQGGVFKGGTDYTGKYALFLQGAEVIPFDEVTTINIIGEQIDGLGKVGIDLVNVSGLVNKVNLNYLPPPTTEIKVVTVGGSNVITGDIADIPSTVDIAQAVDDILQDDFAGVGSGSGGGLDETALHAGLDSYANKSDYKADVSTLAQELTVIGLNDFNPLTDVVNHVTIVDTVTVNTDMRGTDGANTTVPNNSILVDILNDTNELQLNQGGWVTAVGFATAIKQDAMQSSINVNSGVVSLNLDAKISDLVTLLPDERLQLLSLPSADEVKNTILGVESFP